MASSTQFFRKAKELLAQEDDTLLCYAALELRFCIEVITYEKLNFHKDVLPESVKNIWQPDRFFRVLERLEPGTVRNCTISIGKENTRGVPPATMFNMGNHKTFDIKWLRKNYQRLGSYLHVQKKDTDRKRIRGNLIKIMKETEEVINSPIKHFSMAMRGLFPCGKCGEKIPINLDAIYDHLKKREVLKEVECLSEKCGVINFINQDNEGNLVLVVTSYLFECKKCKESISLKADLKLGDHFNCRNCKKKYIISQLGINEILKI